MIEIGTEVDDTTTETGELGVRFNQAIEIFENLRCVIFLDL